MARRSHRIILHKTAVDAVMRHRKRSPQHRKRARVELTEELNAELTADLTAELTGDLTTDLTAGDFAANGLAPAPEETTAPPTIPPIRSGEPSASDPARREWESLVAIARRHATIALASPPDARAERLDACRAVWLHYAAAFGAGVAAQARFADELQEVTRALMAEQQESGAAPEPEAERPPALAPRPVPPIITIEELRPLLQQIIRQ